MKKYILNTRVKAIKGSTTIIGRISEVLPEMQYEITMDNGDIRSVDQGMIVGQLYKLQGEAENREISLNGKELDPKASQKIHNHSPDGFNWGYGGSGPAQLALAIMLKLTGKPDKYQQLKWDVIAKIPQGQDFEIEFTLPESEEGK